LVGWSSAERNRIAALLYAGRARTKPEPIREGDPTAPALSDCKPEARIESDREDPIPVNDRDRLLRQTCTAAARCLDFLDTLATILAFPDATPQPC